MTDTQTQERERALTEYLYEGGKEPMLFRATSYTGWLLEMLATRGWQVAEIKYDALANRYWVALTDPNGKESMDCGTSLGMAALRAASNALLSLGEDNAHAD